MDSRAHDLCFLPDEKFDFDVSLSPASSKGDDDEDEVFFGPVGHEERRGSVEAESVLERSGVCVSWSPLAGDQLEAMCQEARGLANRLLSRPRSQDQTAHTTADVTADRDDFVQSPDVKLHVLCPTAGAIKRQTFCVQDSPLKQLPPAVQRRLLGSHSATTASPPRPANGASSPRPSIGASSRHPSIGASSPRPSIGASSPRPSIGASSRRPANGASSARHSSTNTNSSTRLPSSPRVGSKAGLRGKTTLSIGAVLPNKPAAPATSCSDVKSKVEKTRLQPPNQAGGFRKGSPTSRPSRRAESSEDLASDSANAASDVSDSSLNSCTQGKCTLAPPTKTAVRNLSGVITPTLQSRRVKERKNTSSSSSSVSSFNSSISVSPAEGKLNSSLSASVGPAPSCIGRPVNHTMPRRSVLDSTADTAASSTIRRSMSAQIRKTHETGRIKAAKSTPVKRAEATPHRPTPSKKAAIPGSTSTRPQIGWRVKSKPEALIPPTLRGGDDTSKMMKLKRLMSAGSVDRPPQKPATDPLTPSSGSSRSLQTKPRRPSALPTPVKFRMSSIPVATPTKRTQPMKLLLSPDSDSAPGSALTRRESSCSPAPTGTQEVELTDAPDIQPFPLEVEEVVEKEETPAPLPSSPPQLDQSERMDSGTRSPEEAGANKNLIELETAEERSKRQEVLLLDLPAPALQPQEKLLIDLTNTPDLIRTGNKSCTTSQLIDLSSPLIKWSPEDKRENTAPLVNLSF
ncbi:G2 and S phase-expressed protein 1 [Brachionichthys hirsutus]|uniref:G2 and S phase-expressed protein 1 n=1 Tax=Brachionichthys hirsutus TaxID=412623 RepID=UPI003604AB26